MDDNFPSVRKNLNILSVLILVLAFSNAEINRINFLGIDLELDGEKLFISLYVLYLYFLWRYLTMMLFRTEFMNHFHNFMLSSPHGFKKEFAYEKRKNEYQREFEDLQGIENDRFGSIVSISFTRNSFWKLSRLNMKIEYRKSATEEEKEMGSPGNKVVSKEVRVSYWYLLRKFLLFCIYKDKFGERVFPLIPVFVNLLFFLFKEDWQGGLLYWLS